MFEEYTVDLVEDDEVYEYEEHWPETRKYTHYPLHGPYTSGHNGSRLLSFSPGSLGGSPLFQDVRVYHFSIYGKIEDNEDEREAWADPIRFDLLRRLMGKDWHWYISARGHYPDPLDPDGTMPLDDYLKNTIAPLDGLKTTSVRTYPDWSGKMVNSQWVWEEIPATRTFIEIPSSKVEVVCQALWSYSTYKPIEGYCLPPGSLHLLEEWGRLPLNADLFRRVVDASSVLFYTWPAENVRFAFLTNKWTFEDMQRMIDVPSLQERADQIKEMLSGDEKGRL